jgi:hypothetical protein
MREGSVELSGRRLDAEVERVIFGRVCCPLEVDGEMRFAAFGAVPPHYSTDPAAARQVREEMARQGYQWTLSCIMPEYRMEFWLGGREVGVGEADTEELAVAKAALAALASATEPRGE